MTAALEAAERDGVLTALQVKRAQAVLVSPGPARSKGGRVVAAVERPSRNPASVELPASFCLRAGIGIRCTGDKLKDGLRDRRGNLPPLCKLLSLGLSPAELYHCGFVAADLEPLQREHLSGKSTIVTELVQYFGLTKERIFDLAERDLDQLAALPVAAEAYGRCGVTVEWLVERGLTASTLVNFPFGVAEAVERLGLDFEQLLQLHFGPTHCQKKGWSYIDVRKVLRLTPTQTKQLGIDVESLVLRTAGPRVA